MSRSLIHICFEPRSIVGVQVLGLAVRHDLGFVPETIRSSKQRRNARFSDASLEESAAVGVDDWLRIEAEAGRFELGGVRGQFLAQIRNAKVLDIEQVFAYCLVLGGGTITPL